MDLTAQLTELRQRLDRDRATNIGFPGAVDFDYAELAPFYGYLLNNVGDPFAECAGAHTHPMERWVVQFLADLFRAPAADRWGYVTSGGTDGNQYGLQLARNLYPDGLVYMSAAAHYSVPKVVQRLRMRSVCVRTTSTGEVDYHDLRAELHSHRDRPAIVVATIGTTMTEAVDCVHTIRQVLRDAAILDAYVHADAALAGIPLALLDPAHRPGLDMADGADSVAVSGHKFIGSPYPPAPMMR